MWRAFRTAVTPSRAAVGGLARSALSLAVVAITACDTPVTPTLAPHSLVYPLEGPCPGDDASLARGEFVSEVQELAVTITAPDLPSPVEVRGSGQVTVEDVPAGEGRIIGLFGLVGGQSVWRGVSDPVTLTAGETTNVDVLLARVADLSCARSTVGRQTAFHTATQLNDGRVLIVGGAELVDASATCTGCLRATGNNGASIYDPKLGTFEVIGGLTDARFFHTATRLADGRVVVAGGTSAALLRPVGGQFQFPIEPTGPLASIEIFDPAQKRFTPAGALPDGNARVFAAATQTLDGEVIITGGIPGTSTVNDLSNALDTTVVCGGSTISCRVGPPLASKRAGHLIFTANPEGTIIWGGGVGQGAFFPEALRQGGAAFETLQASQASATRNPFFAAGAQYFNKRFLAAGGIMRQDDGSFTTVDGAGNSLSARALILNFTVGAAGEIAAPLTMNTGIVFGTAAGLPDKSSAVIAGGFQVGARFGDFNWTPTSTLSMFTEEPFEVRTLSVGGSERGLRDPRGGATATAIGDGTVLFTGGYAGGSSTLTTAEIFADPKNPPQVAGVTQ